MAFTRLHRAATPPTMPVGMAYIRAIRTMPFNTATPTSSVRYPFGARLTEAGALDSPADVFSLSVDEILGFVRGTAVTTDLRGLG